DLIAEADAIEAAVQKTLAQGYRTGDIFSAGMTLVGTLEMGQKIIENL
ncbi:MAG: isocitrate/isopropylmalate family dehydrogenase, partial [Acetobacterium sp.]|nr:isocitrate/isopropylmalate family dehydrogenase [Acetobacterium sp.]